MNHRPSDGTHTPRWNVEHMAGRELLFRLPVSDRDLFHFFRLARWGFIPVPTGADRPLQLVHVEDLARGLVHAATAARATAADAHFRDYRLDVGEGDAPIAWTPVASGRAPVPDGLLGRWNNRGIAGPYTLRLTASDLAGNSREALLPLTVLATDPLIDSVSIAPPIFSPNGDGRRDITELQFAITDPAHVTLDVLSGGVVVATLPSPPELPAGTHTFAWNGLTGTGAAFEDGEYVLRVAATAVGDPGRTQAETITARLDATAPVVAVTAPLDGAYVRGDLTVTGDVIDAHIDAYTVRYGTAAAGPTVTLDEGGQSRTGHTFGALQGLADGIYILRVSATDLAENTTTVDRVFSIDNEAPGVALTAPETGTISGASTAVQEVRGAITEVNLREWTVRVGAGLDPASWTPLATDSTVPASDLLASWDTTGLADGPYTISLLAEDRAGATAEARTQVIVDHTAPLAAIGQPIDGAHVSAAIDIRGDAADANFRLATLEISEGDAASASRFVPLTTLQTAVTNGSLFVMEVLPADGIYTLRLAVEDRAGQRSERLSTIVVDTEPPLPVAGLTAALEQRRHARLNWPAAQEAGARYNVYRLAQKLTPAPLGAPTYLDENLSDGIHRYTVTVVDLAGQESVASNEAGVTVDLTAPDVALHAPANGAFVSDLVDVRGTATSVDDFREYRVFVGEGAAPASFTLIRRSGAPVTAGLLTQWDTAALAQGAVMTLRLEAEDLSGNTNAREATVTIDNGVPAAPVLLSVTQTGTSLTVTWQAPPDTDLAGHLVYQGDQLANARRLVSGSLTPYIVQGTSYVDAGLVDGGYEYFVVAVNRAGNVSAPSNTIEALLETRAPRMTIVQPADGTVTDAPVVITATTPDADVASVQFQFRPTTTSVWTDLGAPISVPPFSLTWDPRTVPEALYLFRAIGTDVRGNTDTVPNTIPPMVSIRHRDVTAPAPPANLTATVTEGTVQLSWVASPDADVVRYEAARQSGTSVVGVANVPAPATTFSQVNVADGEYGYFVWAVDEAGNRSPDSNIAPALVFTPRLLPVPLCVAQSPITIGGIGAREGVTVTLSADAGGGPAPVATAVAVADGSFLFAGVPLVPGPNVFTAQAVDAAGNSSKRSAASTVTLADAPGVVSGLTAGVVGFDVSLDWLPAAGATGYAVYRDGVSIGPAADVTVRGTPSASSEHPNGHVASRAMDGDLATFWAPQLTGDPTAWWQLDFAGPIGLRELRIQWYPGIHARDFELQSWNGEEWTALATISGNTLFDTVVPVEPVQTSKLRIFVTAADAGAAFIREVQAIAGGTTTETTFVDSGRPDGRYVYAVRGAIGCGLEGEPVEVEAVVGDVVAPAAPANLIATATGSDVLLAWTANVEPDLDGYHVERRSDSGEWTRLTTDPVEIPAFTDPLLANGAYTYRVTAVDEVGNESAPSNEATAVVAASGPAAPTLAISAPAAGGMLDLTWVPEPASAPEGFRLLRGLAAGGPYDDVAADLLTGTSYRDRGLANGVTYYYVVRGVDAVGNEGPLSNEASATPVDHEPPAAPLLLDPTVAARPIVVAAGSTRVVGVSEPASVVSLLRSGVSLGSTQALPAPVVEELELADDIEERWSFNAARGLLAFFIEAPDGNGDVLTVTDVATRQTRQYPPVGFGDHPSFTSDGSLLAYSGRDPATFARELHVIDVSSAAIVLRVPLPDRPDGLAMSPDGQRAALVFNFEEIWIAELAVGSVTQLVAAGGDVEGLTWAPDGRSLLYTLSGDELVLLDVATGDDNFIAAIDGSASFSPDGSAIVFEGEDAIRLYDVASDDDFPLLESGEPVIGSRPVFSAEGLFVAYLNRVETDDGDIVDVRVKRLGDETPAAVIAGDIGEPDLLMWAADRTLVALEEGDDDGARILEAGRFAFDGIALDPGLNLISAIATDAAAHISGPADPIAVTLDTSGLSDLVIRDVDLFAYPLFPAPGERVRIAATVRNAGNVSAAGVTLAFVDAGEQGTGALIGSLASLGTIAPGGQATASVDWDAIGEGPHTILVRVDPFGAVAEVSESNNTAARDVIVSGSGLPDVRITADRATYGPSDTVALSVAASNPGAPAGFSLEVTIEDALGNFVATALTETFDAFPYSTRGFVATWPAEGALAGEYRARATWRRADGVSATSAAPFSVSAIESVTASLTTDRAAYTTGDVVRLAGVVRNTSANVDLADISAVVEVRGIDGVVVHHEIVPIGTLLLGAQAQASAIWPAGAPAAYTATIQARQGERVLADASRSFAVAGVSRVSGALQAAATVPFGGAVSVDAAVTNSGTLGLTAVPLRLRVVDSASAESVRLFETTIDLPPGATVPWAVSVDTSGLPVKAYTLALDATLEGADTPLASASVAVLDVVAPLVEIVAPAAGTVTGTDLMVTARALDSATSVSVVELRVDEGPWQRMAVADAASGRYAHRLPVSAALEGPRVLSVRASDAAGNGADTSSSDANPALAAFTVDLTPPEIAVAGVEDGGLYRAAVTPVVTVTDATLLTTAIQLNGAPFASGTAVSEPGEYALEIAASDRAGNTAGLTVRFTIGNGPPTATDVEASTPEDTAVALALIASDPEGDPLTFAVAPPANGTLTGAAPLLTYTPHADFHGVDVFTFTVSDANSTSAAATVTVTVTPVNDAPGAHAGAARSVPERTAVVLDGSGSSDVDGDSLTYAWSQEDGPSVILDLSDPVRPTFVAPDVPRAGAALAFALVVSDGTASSVPAGVTITVTDVNRVPAAADQQVDTDEDTPVDFTLGATDPDDDELTFEVGAPAHGTLSGVAPHLTYTPAADFHGADQFTFTVSDGIATSTPAMVAVTVAPVNDVPVADAGPDQTAAEGTTVVLDGSASADADDDPLTFVWTQVDGPAVALDLTDPIRPTFAAPDVPPAGDAVTLELVVHDGTESSQADRVVVAITSTNRPPVVVDAALGTAEDTAATIGIDATDPDDDALALEAGPAAHGTVTASGLDVTYTPEADFHGADQFAVTVRDPEGLSASARVFVTVTPVNDAPVAHAGADQTVREGDAVTLDGTGSHDVDGDALAWAWEQVAGPAVALQGAGTAQPTFVAPDVEPAGAVLSFRLVVSDGRADSGPAHVNVVVTSVNRAPVAEAGPPQTVSGGAAVTLDGSASFDPDGDPLSYRWLQLAGPAVELTGADTARPVLTAPLLGMRVVLTFELTVGDGAEASADTVDITVDPANQPPVADAGADQTVTEGDAVTLDGRNSRDPDGDPLTHAWVQTAGPTVDLSGGASAQPAFVAPDVMPPGETLTFELVVRDPFTDSAPDAVDVRVLDAGSGPTCAAAAATPDALWPPNHKLVQVRIAGVTAGSGSSGLEVRITHVTQDEPVNGLGDGDEAPDAVVAAEVVLLRAERAGGGNGRVYRIWFTATDAQQRTCAGSVAVQVPHDAHVPAVDDGQTYTSTTVPGEGPGKPKGRKP